jgi:hypothetical protein
MKKADLNFSFDNYMMKYRNLFRLLFWLCITFEKNIKPFYAGNFWV